MWPFKSKRQRHYEMVGRAMSEGFTEGIRRSEAGEPSPPLSPEAAALMERMITRSVLFWGVEDDDDR